MIKTKTLTIKIKNDLETDDNVMVDIDTDSGEAIDDIKDEDDNKNDAINNDMDTDGNVEVDIDTLHPRNVLFLREFYSLHY